VDGRLVFNSSVLPAPLGRDKICYRDFSISLPKLANVPRRLARMRAGGPRSPSDHAFFPLPDASSLSLQTGQGKWLRRRHAHRLAALPVIIHELAMHPLSRSHYTREAPPRQAALLCPDLGPGVRRIKHPRGEEARAPCDANSRRPCRSQAMASKADHRDP
jgi:hypothetical protein